MIILNISMQENIQCIKILQVLFIDFELKSKFKVYFPFKITILHKSMNPS